MRMYVHVYTLDICHIATQWFIKYGMKDIQYSNIQDWEHRYHVIIMPMCDANIPKDLKVNKTKETDWFAGLTMTVVILQ